MPTDNQSPGSFDGAAVFRTGLELVQEYPLVLIGVPFLLHLAVSAMVLAADGVLSGAGDALNLFLAPILFAVSVLLARDALAGRGWAGFNAYLQAATARVAPLVILTIAQSILIVLGMILLIVPGLWMAGALYCLTPIILFEPAPWGALQRSRDLTRNVVWSVVGVVVRIVLLAIVAAFVTALVAGILAQVGLGLLGGALFVALSAGVSAVSGACALQTYLTLTGGTPEGLEEVFS